MAQDAREQGSCEPAETTHSSVAEPTEKSNTASIAEPAGSALTPAPLTHGAVVDDAEVYLLFDKRDELMIADSLAGAYLDEFVYELQKNGRAVMRNGEPVRELTYAGILEAARIYGGIQVPIDQSNITETDTEFRAVVQAIDKRTGASRLGVATCAKNMTVGIWDSGPDGRRRRVGDKEVPDPFAMAKAVSKAERNSIRKLLPYSQMKKWVTTWLRDHGQPVENERPGAAVAVKDEVTDWLKSLPTQVKEGIKNLGWSRPKTVVALSQFMEKDGTLAEDAAVAYLNAKLDEANAEAEGGAR